MLQLGGVRGFASRVGFGLDFFVAREYDFLESPRRLAEDVEAVVFELHVDDRVLGADVCHRSEDLEGFLVEEQDGHFSEASDEYDIAVVEPLHGPDDVEVVDREVLFDHFAHLLVELDRCDLRDASRVVQAASDE